MIFYFPIGISPGAGNILFIAPPTSWGAKRITKSIFNDPNTGIKCQNSGGSGGKDSCCNRPR